MKSEILKHIKTYQIMIASNNEALESDMFTENNKLFIKTYRDSYEKFVEVLQELYDLAELEEKLDKIMDESADEFLKDQS